jgi:molybdopterin converting factor small subunit
MQVTVRLFGHYSDYSRDAILLDVPDGSSVRDLAGVLAELDSRLKGIVKCRAAINAEYCASDDVVNDGDEVAFIPPMSGG